MFHCQVAQVFLVTAAIFTRAPLCRWQIWAQGKHTFPMNLPEMQGDKIQHQGRKKQTKKKPQNKHQGKKKKQSDVSKGYLRLTKQRAVPSEFVSMHLCISSFCIVNIRATMRIFSDCNVTYMIYHLDSEHIFLKQLQAGLMNSSPTGFYRLVMINIPLR